jgi:hypothetical protein
VIFRAFELQDGASASCSVPDRRGDASIRLEISRQGTLYKAQAEGRFDGNWTLEIAGTASTPAHAEEAFIHARSAAVAASSASKSAQLTIEN